MGNHPTCFCILGFSHRLDLNLPFGTNEKCFQVPQKRLFEYHFLIDSLMLIADSHYLPKPDNNLINITQMVGKNAEIYKSKKPYFN